MASPYATATEASPVREPREVESALEQLRRLNDIALKAVARTMDMKHRLLGLVEPQAGIGKDGPKPVPCELTELRQLIAGIDTSLDRVHENITALERI